MGKKRSGFTLIEVIAALFIFVVAAGAFMEAVFTIHNALKSFDSRDSSDADLRFVRRAVLSIGDRDKIEEGDDIETLSSGKASWEAEVEETEVVDLFKLKLTITLADTEDDEPHEFELYVLRPGWSEAVERSVLLTEKRNAVTSERDF